MISYIKIYGPPLLESIIALEKIAVDLPETCIMDHAILNNISKYVAKDLGGWFSSRGVIVPIERCNNIISKSGKSLGEYDFFFEWNEQPEMEKIVDLMQRIDEALTEVGSRYTITSKRASF
jgi:hypothetical protein